MCFPHPTVLNESVRVTVAEPCCAFMTTNTRPVTPSLIFTEGRPHLHLKVCAITHKNLPVWRVPRPKYKLNSEQKKIFQS